MMKNMPRRAGKTTFDCHLIACALESGEQQVVVIMPNHQYLRHVRPLLTSVLAQHGIAVRAVSEREWETSGPAGMARILFRSSDAQSIVGFQRPIIDLDDRR